jgi:uncharacterized protein (TIGR02996 family)
MLTKAGFLHDIKLHPEDDARRLVFADWLMEQGDPRGELLHMQVERSRLSPRDPKCLAYEDRERALMEQHADEWFGPLVKEALWKSERGLLHLDVAASVFFIPAWQAWLASDAFAWAERLRVHGLSREQARTLAGCAYLEHLTTLDLWESGVRNEQVRTLAPSPHLRNLHTLILSRLRLGPSSAVALAKAPSLCGLRELVLSHNRLGDSGVRSLALSPHFGGLQRLELQANELTDDAVAALVESPTLRGLEHLSLWHNRISPAGQERLRERFGSRVAL